MSDWIQSFKGEFGDAIWTDDAFLDAQSNLGVMPAWLCLPESEEQAAAMIRFAASHKIPVVPYGSGTSQRRCAPPPKDFLALCTWELNKLIRHEPGDMVATVQGGMFFSEFQHSLRERGQWLPIDAPSGATIGGTIATNTYGARALGYGTVRDMVLGMTVINGDGVIRKCGGKVVKNVTGYALDKMYIGSFGTLGLITEVTFKLQPSMPESYFKYAKLPDIHAGVDALQVLASKNLPIEMLQICVRHEEKGAFLFVCAAGTDAELQRIHQEISGSLNLEFRGDFVQFNHGRPCGNEEWGFNHRLFYASVESRIFEMSRQRESIGALFRFGCVPSQLSSAFQILHDFETAPQAIGLHGGIIDLAPLTDAEAARVAGAFEKIGVNFAFENVVGVDIPNRWGTPRPEWAIMKQIKAALDPQGIMNPGRFVV